MLMFAHIAHIGIRYIVTGAVTIAAALLVFFAIVSELPQQLESTPLLQIQVQPSIGSAEQAAKPANQDLSSPFSDGSVEHTALSFRDDVDVEVLQGNEPCQTATKALLETFMNTLDPQDPGPLLVGGIGDSGTRGAQQLLSKIGVDMGHFRFPGIPDSVFFTYDSLLYMSEFDVQTCEDGNARRLVKTRHVYGKAIQVAHTVGYSRDQVDNDVWLRGMQLVLNMTIEMQHLARHDVVHDPEILPALLFGFKHPRTSLMLPIFKAALGRQFKFVHILRDGRDVANGSNQQMFNGLCQMYFGRTCRRSLKDRLVFWATMNVDVAHWAATHLHENQYHVLRTEDLIDSHLPCFKSLAVFVGVNDAIFEERVTPSFVHDNFHSHAYSYSGRKWTHEQSVKFTEAAAAIPVVRQAMQLFGYDLRPDQPWSRLNSCTELSADFRALAAEADPFNPPL
ncbi:Hypothetical Protein FCC1311_006542 [Hondaea fermentalgiana]|uniref:Uncharacterized protein n=1 Tax=Hondaea fermentalgiana TaxID=2315210 RepID=A0A2R5G076_9STRA|nr:Hypothetical Protein FCC1311_006542 [Hondaea fermentalgiana]|eukprot:GBG24436.1 Hypothetical Protein FCC1311_006542 [Hondaea fermentalgiana]